MNVAWCRAVGFWHEKRSERYIEDTDRFPGWKGELPVPIQDFRNGSDAGEAPASLTIGVGANGKVAHSQCSCIKLQQVYNSHHESTATNRISLS